MKLLFWLSLGFTLYTFLGYPLWLALLKLIRPKPTGRESVAKRQKSSDDIQYTVPSSKKISIFSMRNEDNLTSITDHRGEYEPIISVVIAAHNEEKNIARRVRDVMAQEYPVEKLEIIVASDGSNDRTVEVLKELHLPNLKILALLENKGKADALNAGVAAANGEVVIFTDARQTFAPGAIRNLTEAFADQKLGCMSGELIFLLDKESTIQAEMGAYWKYEKWIRKTESITGSTVGATGAIYAIRRRLYKLLPQGTLLDDVLTPLNIVMQGYRCQFSTESIAYDVVSQDVSQEWKRKVRTFAGNWQILSLSPTLLLPWKNPLWWRFLVHKIFRLLVPAALAILLVASISTEGMLYHVVTILELSFYGIALIAWFLPSIRGIRLVNLTYFFMVMNAAAVSGFWRWATGQCATAWRPAYK